MSGLPLLFKQGTSARARVLFFAFLSILLLVVDSHVHTLDNVRKGAGTALYPLQMLALMPRDGALRMADYFASLSSLEDENKALKLRQLQSAQMLQQERLLFAENSQLRNLLGMQQKLPVKSVVGEILYDARDPSTLKVVLNRGSQQDVALGQPVIDDLGIVGQITRVFPFTSEVTLLTDKDQAIPVQVLRNGLRSIAYGRGQSGVLDLRVMAANADIQSGDTLVTSGIDGVYPAGLVVASVTRVETKSSDTFPHIVCTPIAGIDRHKQLLILLVDSKMTPRLPPDDAPAKNGKSARISSEVRDRLVEKPLAAVAAAATSTASATAATPAVAATASGAATAPVTAAKPNANGGAAPAAAASALASTVAETKAAIAAKPTTPAAASKPATPVTTSTSSSTMPSQPPKAAR